MMKLLAKASEPFWKEIAKESAKKGAKKLTGKIAEKVGDELEEAYDRYVKGEDDTEEESEDE